MRHLVWLLLLTGCTGSVSAPGVFDACADSPNPADCRSCVLGPPMSQDGGLTTAPWAGGTCSSQIVDGVCRATYETVGSMTVEGCGE